MFTHTDVVMYMWDCFIFRLCRVWQQPLPQPSNLCRRFPRLQLHLCCWVFWNLLSKRYVPVSRVDGEETVMTAKHDESSMMYKGIICMIYYL